MSTITTVEEGKVFANNSKFVSSITKTGQAFPSGMYSHQKMSASSVAEMCMQSPEKMKLGKATDIQKESQPSLTLPIKNIFPFHKSLKIHVTLFPYKVQEELKLKQRAYLTDKNRFLGEKKSIFKEFLPYVQYKIKFGEIKNLPEQTGRSWWLLATKRTKIKEQNDKMRHKKSSW